MASNGWLYCKGHSDAVVPTWVDAVLQGSTSIVDIDSFEDDGDLIAIYGTGADVVIVNVDDAVQVGYATLANITCVRKVGDIIYIGTSDAGIYSIDVAALDFQTANGDITPLVSGYWAATYDTLSTPAILSNNVVDMTAHADEYLAIISQVTAWGTSKGVASIIDIDGAAVYDENDRHNDHELIEFKGDYLYVTSGRHISVLYDVTAVAADDWEFDVSTASNFDYTFPGGLDNLIGWVPEIDATAAVSSVAGTLVGTYKIRMTTKANVRGTNCFTRVHNAAFYAGDFDVAFNFGVPTHSGHPWPVPPVPLGTYECGYGLYVTFPGTASGHTDVDYDGVFVERAAGYNPGAYSHVRSKSDYAGGPWTYADYGDTGAWIRLVRSGSTISVYYGASANPTTLLQEYTSQPTSPALFSFLAFTGVESESLIVDMGDMDDTWAPAEAYAGLPSKRITSFDATTGTSVVDPTAASDTLFIAYNDRTIRKVSTDQTSQKESEGGGAVTTEAVGGDDYYIAVEDTATAIAGKLYAASTSAGIIVRDIGDGSTYTTHTTSTGQPLTDNDIRCIRWAGSFLYGALDGGGWIEPDAEAPADTDAYSREDETGVLTGAGTPTEPDYDHSYVKRRLNGGAWSTLKSDGWGGAGATVEMNGSTVPIAYLDIGVARGKYEYRYVHVDDAGNESTGSDPSQPSYVDQPTPLALTLSASSTQRTGITATVSADSGADSGHVADAVEYVQFKVGAGEYGEWMKYDSSADYPIVLPTAPGTYEVRARFASRGLLYFSAQYASDTVQLLAGLEIDITQPASIEAFDIAGPFYSDLAAVTLSAYDSVGLTDRSDADYPLSNWQEPRLGVKTLIDTTGIAAGNGLTCVVDLGADKELVYLMIAGHNLADFDGVCNIYVTTHTAAGAQPSYTKINNICTDDPLVLDLSQDGGHDARYVRLVFTGGAGSVLPAHLEIGRLAVVIKSDTYLYSPTRNIQWDFEYGLENVTQASNETPGGRYAANPEYRYKAVVDAVWISEDDFTGLSRKYQQNYTHTPVLVLLDPGRIPDHQTDGTAADADYAAGKRLCIYGYFDNAEVLGTISQGYLSSFSGLRFVEARAGDDD